MHGSDYRIIQKSKFFDKKWYKKRYLDPENLSDNPIKHYLKKGWIKGYNPSLYFDGNAYLEQNQDVKHANINPLLHYEKWGKYEGRRISDNAEGYKIGLIKILSETIKKYCAQFIYRKSIKENQDKRILVVLHLFYMNSWDAIKLYLNNLKAYKFDLIVTCVDGNYNHDVLEKIKKYHVGTKFFIYPNQGFDIGPFVDVISKIDISKYDIVFKLHSKGIHRKFIFIYNQIFKNNDWFCNLYNGILGAYTVHKVIKEFSADKKVGLVASKNLIIHDPKHKIDFTNQIANMYNIKIKPDYQYVAGSCFAVRAKCLGQIKNLNLNIDSFAPTVRGVFSLAHAMERIVCATVEYQGFKFCGISVPHKIYKKELKKAKQTSAIRLLDDDRFVLNYDFFYRSLECAKIKNYYVQDVALKDINRNWKGDILKLNQCAPYLYLNGRKDVYKKYCIENKQMHEIEMSVNRFDNLIASIDSNGFDFKSMPVLNAKDNVIMDGQHRSCYLLQKYGPDYKVKALFIELV